MRGRLRLSHHDFIVRMFERADWLLVEMPMVDGTSVVLFTVGLLLILLVSVVELILVLLLSNANGAFRSTTSTTASCTSTATSCTTRTSRRAWR